MSNITLLPTDALQPNDYNPNEMTEAELAEFKTEVEHLGRIPKPVVVRANGTAYVIVDGEHGWRIAREIGFTQIPCEIVDVNDFEAMRQTYKRNQHGSHDPVKLGQMFRRMMNERELSQRALAKEIGVSEGTIRNSLMYADAHEVRNSYAFSELSIRQVRTYLALPPPISDIWLDAGADLDALRRSTENVKIPKYDGTSELESFDTTWLPHMADADVIETIKPGDGQSWTELGFIKAMHRAFQLVRWQETYAHRIRDAHAFIRITARLQEEAHVLYHLPIVADGDEWVSLVTPIQWEDALRDCRRRATNDRQFKAMLLASLARAMRSNGRSEHDANDPRMMLLMENLESAPNFIRESGLDLRDKAAIHAMEADVREDVLLDAKKEACRWLESRDGWLGGDPDLLQALGLDNHRLSVIKTEFSALTPEEAFRRSLQEILDERRKQECVALFADREKLIAAAEDFWIGLNSEIASQTLGDSSVGEIFKRRLARLPTPELKLLSALLLVERSSVKREAASLWLEAIKAENLSDTDMSAEQCEHGE